MSESLSHLDKNQLPQVVDISAKNLCKRTAIAQSIIELDDKIISLFSDNEIKSPKGAVFHTAIIAGIQAVKETYRLIPLCHPIPISACNIEIRLEGLLAIIDCKVVSKYATGVEMEAIMGASVAAITIYDMCKGVSKAMCIKETRLLSKSKEEIT